MPILRTPGQNIAGAKASDLALAQAFFVELGALVQDFQRRHPEGPAHAIMVSTMAYCAIAARAIGMRERDFLTYATLVFRDKA